MNFIENWIVNSIAEGFNSTTLTEEPEQNRTEQCTTPTMPQPKQQT
jgi:hypothetical protein